MNFKKSILSLAVLVTISTLTACGSSSDSSTDPLPIENTAPTDISLSNASIEENAVAGVIGNLSATDADSGDTFTFTTSDERFVINGNELVLAEGISFDYEKTPALEIDVTVADSGSLTFTKSFNIEVTDLLDTYAFDSKFIDGESSVSYTGQIARHALIAELNHFIVNIKTWLTANGSATKDDVLAELHKLYYVGADLNAGDISENMYDSLPITFTEAKQSFISDISSSAKNISEKIAGNDTKGQEIDWNTEFAGWGAKGSTTPESLVLAWFDLLADNAVVFKAGTEMEQVYLTDTGLDLKQLIQKHLLMAVTYSQTAGDYFGVDFDGKGLTTQNTAGDKDGAKAYSTLEHQFDEGFGYFGAPVDYLAYTDDEIAMKDGREDYQGKHDSNGDGEIDLTSEIIFGAAGNAAKRDRGATVATDFTADTMNAFIQGRKIINDAAGAELTDDEMAALLVQRDAALGGWEKAIAATVVHYINDTSADLTLLVNSSDDFDQATMSKHWAEMKGFALGLQFNPYSNFHTDEFAGKFEEMHTLMQDAPVYDETDLPSVTDYIADLEKARDILEEVFGFSSENVAEW
jgi:hypothetical protein